MKSLPIYELQIKRDGENTWVWDMLRKKYMMLTPEEHVRQCLLHFLIEEMGVPKGLISIEKGLKYHQRQKRYDLLVYDRNAQPLISIECKAPYIELDDETAFQLATYNSQIGAPYLMLCNGKLVLFFGKDEQGTFRMQKEIPGFEALLS